jgi:hypothetical protein
MYSQVPKQFILNGKCNHPYKLLVINKKKNIQGHSSKSPYNNAKGHFTKVIASSGNNQEGSGSA